MNSNERETAVNQARTILYIEDDPASRKLVERTLLYAGYRLLMADTGLTGIDMARREVPDLVLTDINLPDISGREITTTLRADTRFARTPIVALTAQALDEQRALTMAAGITGYITKPIDIEALPGQIAHYLSGGHDRIEAEALSVAQSKYAQEVVGRLETRIRELETVNAELRRLDRMKDSFIQLTAHELRTPLTLIYGYSRLLEDTAIIKAALEADPAAGAIFKGLAESVARMQGIINEILTISRIVTHQIDLSIGPLNLARVADRAIAPFRQALELRRITLHHDSTGWPQHLRGDGELLALALGALISNAIKYTPDGGDIYLTAAAEGYMVRISVRDTGIGIAPDEQTRIFERFHTVGDPLLHSTSKTAFRGGGLGLGLAICKGVVEAHGGRVWVESRAFDPDTCPGSTFHILIPQTVHSRHGLVG